MTGPAKRDPRRPAIERWIERALGDDEPGHFGTGWWSGIVSVFFGLLGCGAVLVLWFPGVLSTAELRARYPMDAMRGLVELVIAVGLMAGCISAVRRRKPVLGVLGAGLALVAALAGGGRVPIEEVGEAESGELYLAFDWFLLNVLVLALVFVALERMLPRLASQGTFRVGWTTDTAHFLVSHVFVQALTFLTLMPGLALADLGLGPAWVAQQPLWLQVVELCVLGDLVQYAVHRAFHRVPFLWRFHAVHHSSRAIDWLAGSRLHLVDATVTRALVVAPLLALGFAAPAFYTWLVILTGHAIFVHANVGLRLTWLEPFVATPRYHHWHHAAEPEAANTNFAVQLPFLDRLFGTHHLPRGRWPAAYGLEGDPVPEGWVAQLVHPLRPGPVRGSSPADPP